MKRKKIIIGGSIIFSLIMLHFILFSGSGLINRYQLIQERDKILKDIEASNTEILNLNKETEALKNSEFEIEKYARDNYKMIKPGEIIIKIEEATNK